MEGDHEGEVKEDGSQPPASSSGSSSPTSISNRLNNVRASAGKLFGTLNKPARIALLLLAAAVVAALLLWVIDKLVFYYLARSYVDEVANVLDLNQHLANALVIATFILAVFFARLVWSFSSQRRWVGVTGLGLLLIGHSLVLWYATRDKPFDREGHAIKCYVLTRDGQVSYGERVGIDPATGRQCRSVTPEMFERLQKYAAGKRPHVVAGSNPVFFDPRSGEPIVWYYKNKDGDIEIFDLMGFHPDTGEELLPISKEVAQLWKKQSDEKDRRVPKLISEPDKFVFFDPLNGRARAWYWLTADGRYEFYDSAGYQPQTGDKLELVTREVVSKWKDGQNNPVTPSRAPSRVQINSDTVFFDPVSGNPRLWYWRREKGDYEFFDGPGFHPQNGQPLQSFTKDNLTQYQQEIEEKGKQLKAEQERIEAEQKAKQQAEATKQAEQRQRAEADQRKREEETRRLSEAARKCDDLAANPGDPRKASAGVPYGALKPLALEAVDACEIAVQQNPAELRFKYQLARALELAGEGRLRKNNRQRALEMHSNLVRAGYVAAFDNLASLYWFDRNDRTAAMVTWRKGIDSGDADSMMSLADLIDNGKVVPQSASETPLELYRRAAELGNENGARAYQAELVKAEQQRQLQIQQLEQQRIILQTIGGILQGVRR
jgi:hypothetical protein